MRETLEGKFTVKTENGTKYTVLIYQEWIDATTHDDDGPSKLPGMKRIVTSEGYHVNQIDPKTLKIVETDEIIRL